MQQILPYLDQFNNKLGFKQLDQKKELQIITQKTGLLPSQAVLLVITLLLSLVALNIGSLLISNLFGLLYPAYKSFKVLESNANYDDKQWLTYWVVFSCLTVFDNLLQSLLFFLPFYYLLKLFLFVFLFHPQTLGATLLYEQALKPFLFKYQSKINQKLDQLNSFEGQQFVSEKSFETFGRSN
ncbi:TB2 HVA22 family protein, putative [Ichthyophthirius multifiliis]|uniref:TB2 HVA22 family protein, putative n=1 Tax=Ichthyophthirius multifiliis TaxID=5932 RepID=G0QP69_ICHMU|nr:TB2 HVA22 family protein, putative [Ichthyophthirius multifiliis]EGR32999.1 TB2 HVA22 family protein, putative [Ichthyophthirius multifiliis]|eukprot:XP_004036985.1 TB2 HVA22 family protein, putative [Ichthyophthirius multifiliis]